MTRHPEYRRHTQGSKWIRPEKRLAIYLRDRFSCCYCGRDLRHAEPTMVTLDHLRPRYSGGSNEATNLVTACKTCNSARKEQPWYRYASGGAKERIQRQRRHALNVRLARSIINGDVDVSEVR